MYFWEGFGEPAVVLGRASLNVHEYELTPPSPRSLSPHRVGVGGALVSEATPGAAESPAELTFIGVEGPALEPDGPSGVRVDLTAETRLPTLSYCSPPASRVG